MYIKTSKSVNGKVDNTNDIIHLTNNSGSSDGITLISKESAIYIPNTSTDLLVTLDVLVNIIDVLANGILPSNTGGAITNVTFSTDLMQIKQNLNKIKQELK